MVDTVDKSFCWHFAVAHVAVLLDTKCIRQQGSHPCTDKPSLSGTLVWSKFTVAILVDCDERCEELVDVHRGVGPKEYYIPHHLMHFDYLVANV